MDWERDGSGGSVERVADAAAALAEAPGTTADLDYDRSDDSWEALTDAQRQGWCDHMHPATPQGVQRERYTGGRVHEEGTQDHFIPGKYSIHITYI